MDRLVRDAWSRVLALIPDNPSTHHAIAFLPAMVRREVSHLAAALPKAYQRELYDLALWGHATAARSISAAARRHQRKSEKKRDPKVNTGGEVTFTALGSVVTQPALVPPKPPPPGSIAAAAGGDRFDYSGLVIQPPTVAEITRIVGPVPLSLTRLGAEKAAATVWQGIASGQNRLQIAKSLQKQFDGYAAAARRVARTEGLRVATETQLSASEQLSDMITGYQILATLDDRTRPEHRERHGRIYYRDPKGNQKGFDEMPRPPIDPGGEMAWNCRCTMAPVFAGEETPDVGYLAGTPYSGAARSNAALASLATV